MKTKIKTTLALIAAFCGLQLFTATPAMAETVAFDNTCRSYDTGVANFQDTETWKITIPASDTLPAGSQVRVTSVSFGLNSSDDALNVKKLKITVSGADVFSGLANGTGEKQTSTKMSDGSFKQKYDFGAEGSDNECILSVGTAYTFALVDANGSPVLQRCCCKKTSDAANSPVKQDTSLQDYRISQYIEADVISTDVYCSYINGSEWWSDVGGPESTRVTKGGSSASFPSTGGNLQLEARSASTLNAGAQKTVLDLYLVGSSDTANLTIPSNFTFSKVYAGIPLTIQKNNVTFTGLQLVGRGSLTFDGSANSFTVDNDNTKTAIRTATDKVNFKGSGSNGITLNYGVAVDASLSSHLIFDGGTHAFTYGMGSKADLAFSTTGTLDNPTILVKDGTTLNYTMKDMNGWNGGRKDGTFVRVASGATMNFLPSGNSSMFMSGRLVLEPGSTTTYKTGTDNNGFCVYGGVDTSKAQIYVPSPASGAVNTVATLSKHADSSKNLTFGVASGTGGAAITVDADATLQINGPISGGQQVTKGGTGTLVLNGDTSGYTGNFNVDAGVVELTNNTGYNFNIPNRKLKGTLRIASNAKYTAKTGDSVNYDGTGNVEVYGALDMSTKRWTYKSNNKLYIYAGGTISGTGDSEGAIVDYNQGNTLYAKDSTSETKTATISGPTKFQGAMTVSVDPGVTLAMSGAMVYANSQTHTKNGAGTLVLSGTQTNPGNASWTISAGTLSLPNSNASGLNKITISSGATLEPARGITLPTVDGNGQIYVTLTDEETGGTSESLTIFTCASKADTVSVFVTDSQGRQYAVTKTDNNYIVNPKSPKGVAKIVETEKEYQTVAAALAAVASGQTVQLLADSEEALSTAATCTLDLNGHSFNGTLQINEGGVITMSGTSFTKDFNRYMLTNTTGDGTLRLNAGSTNIELASAGDTSPLVANVNIEYLGTCELQYVGTLGENDKFIVPAGKTVTFANGSICPMRNELIVNGTVIAKNILIGHYSDGDYPGKATINAGGSVKTEVVSFRNAGGTDSDDNRSVLEVTGTLELTKSDAAALTKTAGAKNLVKLNGGTVKAETASWYTSGDINITAVADTTTTVSAAADKTANLAGQFTGTGALVADGAGTVLLSADAQPVTVSEETTFKFQLTQQLQMNGVVASNVTFEDESVTGITFVKTDGTEVAGVGVNNNEFKPILPSGILRYGYAFNGNRDKETEASASISMSGGSASAFEDGFNPPEKAMKFEAGQNYGDSFNFGGGDFTIIAVVKAPTDENRCIFGLGGQSGTAGMLGMARMTGNNIKIFTKNGTELMTVEVADATTKYHTYALRYIKATNKLALSVDFGAYGNEVSFTANTSDAKFQFGGVHGGCPSGISNASNGDIDEFRLYTAQLSVEAVKQAAAPFVSSYEATIPADATGTLAFSTLPWFPATTTVYANRSWTVINRATADVTTVSVDGDAAKTQVTVVSATKVLKFGSPSKLNASAYDFSQAPGGVGFGVTGGWNIPDVLKNYIRDNETKAIFYSDNNGGANFNYGTGEQSVKFKSHLVFEGSTHTFEYNKGANERFAENGTDENPTLLVKNGTVLTFKGHDLGGYQGTVHTDGVVKIEDGGRINMQKNGDGTCYFRQRLIIVPGGVFNIDGMGNNFRLQGGVTSGSEQIVVPASDGSKVAVISGTSASDVIRLHYDSTIGMAISVGAGSTLDIQTKIENYEDSSHQNNFEIGKYGTGLLKLSGDISGYWKQSYDRVVKFSVYAGDIELASATEAKCRFWLSSSSNLHLTGNGTMVSGEIQGDGSVVRNGEGTVTLTSANNNYQGTTTVQAGTLEITGSGTIGSGNYSVAEGATLDLGTHRPAGNLTTSAGTVCVTLTSEEQTKFDNLEQFEILNAATDATLGSLRVFDAGGKEHLNSFVVEGGKVKVQKVDEKTQPFNVTAVGEKNWTAAGWTDSSVEPKTVLSKDWDIEIAANLAVAQDTSAALTLDRNIQLGTFNVTNLGTLAIADTVDYALTAKTIDDSQSTGATTLNFALGAANVTAGANTIIGQSGTGTLTVGSGKKATLAAGATMGTYSLVSGATLRYEGERTEGYTQVDGVTNSYQNANIELTMGNDANRDMWGYLGANDRLRIYGKNTTSGINAFAWNLVNDGGTLIFASNGTESTWYGRNNRVFIQKGGVTDVECSNAATSGNTGFFLNYQNGSTPMQINIEGGAFYVTNTVVRYGKASAANITVSDGLLKVKGIKNAGSATGNTLTVSGGKLAIGDVGMASGIATFTMTGGELNAYADTTIANAITLNDDVTMSADANVTMKVSGAVTGTGTITVSGDGSVVFMQSSGVTPTKVTSGTAYYGFGVDINEAGVFTVPSGYTASTIKLYNAAGQEVTITSRTDTKIYYECSMEDFSAYWKYEFEGNGNNTGTEGTALSWDNDRPFKDNEYVTDEKTGKKSLRVPTRPHRTVSTWPEAATFVMYGTMVGGDNHYQICFGTKSGNLLFLATGDTSKNEVVLCKSTNNAPVPLCTMTVPNAQTTKHLYAFVLKKVGDKSAIDIYLDGALLQPYTFDSEFTLGGGFQIASPHGGPVTGYERTADNDPALLDFLRVYDKELNSDALAKYAKEYPYESPYGTYTRALDGTEGTWVQESQWKSNGTEVVVSEPGTNSVLQITATAATGLAVNLAESKTYENVTFGGDGAIAVTNDMVNSGKVKVTGRITVNTSTRLAIDAFETYGSAISIGNGKVLTLDLGNADISKYWSSQSIDLTGAIICNDYTTQVQIEQPKTVKAPRTVTIRIDPNSKHAWADIYVPTNDIIGTVSGGNITWSWADTAIDESDIDFDQTEVAIKIVMGENQDFTLNEKYAKADLITVNGGNLNIGTNRNMTVTGKGTVDVQLTEEESSSTDELTLFNVTGTADLAFRNVTDHAGQPKTDFIGGNGKIIVNPPATTLTGLHIARIMPKATSRVEDRDPNGRDSGWIDLINYGPTETNLANYQIIRTNLGKEYKTKVGKLLSRTVAKGQIYRIYTSEEYPTAEDYGGDGKTVKAYAKNGEGVVVEDANGIIIVPTKVNPKKYPMVRLVEGSTNIVDEIIVPNDLDDNMQIEVVANADKLERKVVYTNGTKVEYGPAVDAIYGIDGVKSDLKLLNKAKFAKVNTDYTVVFPVNPFRTGTNDVLEANSITNVVLEYRVFDPVEANMPVKAVSNLVMSTATSEKEIANYGAGCQLWTGKIPAEAMVAGKLVQFRAKIFDKGGKVWTAPRNLNPDVGHIWYGVVAQPETTDNPSETTKVCTAKLDTYLMFVSGYNIEQMDIDIDSQDKTKVPYGARCAIYDAKNGVYYDNVRIDLRGQTSMTFTKKSHGLRFSKIAPLKCKDPFTGEEYELRKTSFIAEYGDPACIRQTLALRVMRTAGVKAPFDWPSRLYRNGEYYQLAFHSSRFTDEAVEDIYGLNKYGYSYKNVHQLTTNGGGAEKKTPDDDNEKGAGAYDVLNEYVNRFQNETDPTALTTDAKKHFNLPAWINYMAATKITQECDDVWTNLGVYIDKYEYFLNKNGDDTIRPLAYDMNLSFGVWYFGDDSDRGRIGIVATNDYMKSHPFYGGKNVKYHKVNGTEDGRYNRGMEVILQNETYRNAMVRRLRTLMEVFYGSNDADQAHTPIWQWATEYWDAIEADVPVDHNKWQYTQEHMEKNVSAIWVWTNAMDLAEAKTDLWNNFIVPHRNHLFDTHAAKNAGKTGYPGAIGYATTASAGIPETQSETSALKAGISLTNSEGTKIVTGETKITDGIVGIQNTNNEAIDMSYWQLDGVATLTFAPGTVLPAGTQANPGKLWIVLDRRAAASKIAESDIPMIINVDKNAGETVSGEPQINLKDAEGNVVETCQFYITITTVDEKTVAVVSYEPPAGGGETQLPMDWMVEHGIDTKGNAAQLSTNMNVKVEGGNGATPWESYALGLAPEDPTSKPVIAPVQTSDKDNVTFKLTNVDGAGAGDKNFNVQYRVWAGSTPGAKEGEPSATVGYDATQSMPLPNDGVKYYTIEVITTQKPVTP